MNWNNWVSVAGNYPGKHCDYVYRVEKFHCQIFRYDDWVLISQHLVYVSLNKLIRKNVEVIFTRVLTGALMLSLVAERTNHRISARYDERAQLRTQPWANREDGSFLFRVNNEGRYFLSVSAVGYEQISTKTFDVNKNSSPFDPGRIVAVEKPEELDEVVVEAERPMFEQKIDRAVISVQSNISRSFINFSSSRF